MELGVGWFEDKLRPKVVASPWRRDLLAMAVLAVLAATLLPGWVTDIGPLFGPGGDAEGTARVSNIAQYLANLRSISTMGALNAASVSHDGASGDNRVLSYSRRRDNASISPNRGASFNDDSLATFAGRIRIIGDHNVRAKKDTVFDGAQMWKVNIGLNTRVYSNAD